MVGQLGNIAVLGSTGSIGQQTLDVIRRNPERFKVCALTARSSVDLLVEQAREFEPEFVAVEDQASAAKLSRMLPSRIEVACGVDAICRAASLGSVHTVVGAIVGFPCLAPVLSAIEEGKHIALANKESLVAGGDLVRRALERSNSVIVPVDSEHSSVYQCLRGREGNEIRKIILTASGGPFLQHSREQLASVTPEDAVKHPRWEMGAKISVDSATLMNKGLEVIEAARLFNLPAAQIGVLIHPQSLVHGLVEFTDGTVSAILFETDMRAPISYALGCLYSSDPQRAPGRRLAQNGVASLDLALKQRLEFYEPDLERFPALQLCYSALEAGGNAPIALNAANEVAVEGFLKRELSFTEIPQVVRETVSALGRGAAQTVEDVLNVDRAAREFAAAIRSRSNSKKAFRSTAAV